MKIQVEVPQLRLRSGDEIEFTAEKTTSYFKLRLHGDVLQLVDNGKVIFERKGELCGHGVAHCMRGCHSAL